jgi:zinc transport system permease protein
MGSFVVWRRLAFFGDTLSHGALLGAALGLALGTPLYLPVVLVCLFMAVVLTLLQQQKLLADDTLLGIVAHVTLAVGIIAISLQQRIHVDLFGFLFGDLLAVDWRILADLWGGALLIVVVLAWQWRRLLSITVNEEMAQVEGLPVAWIRLLLMLLLALLVAGAIRIVGVLLITALLVIPAAGARRLTRTPEAMCLVASLIGMFSVLVGIAGSWLFNTPVGPSIVLVTGFLFFLSLLRTV